MRSVKWTHLGFGQIALIAGLAVLLIATIAWGLSAWNASSVAIGKHGWIALGLGTFFSLLIGCGLMALMFFSSRRGTTMPLILSGIGNRHPRLT